MSKIKLCSKDEANLIEELQHLSEVLEDVGVEGVATIIYSPNGDINGAFVSIMRQGCLSLLKMMGTK